MIASSRKMQIVRVQDLLKKIAFTRATASQCRRLTIEAAIPAEGSTSESPSLSLEAPLLEEEAGRQLTPHLSESEYSAQVVHGRSVHEPIYHPKTHGIPVATIQVRGFNYRQLDLYLHFVSHAAAALNIPISRPVHLPTQRSLWTVPRGPFAHKKSQENFDRKVHKRMIKAWDATDAVVTRWIRYIQMYPQPGIGMRLVRWYRAPLGIGKKHEENWSEAQRETERIENVTAREKVEEVAKKIIQQEMAAANLSSPMASSQASAKEQGKKVVAEIEAERTIVERPNDSQEIAQESTQSISTDAAKEVEHETVRGFDPASSGDVQQEVSEDQKSSEAPNTERKGNE